MFVRTISRGTMRQTGLNEGVVIGIGSPKHSSSRSIGFPVPLKRRPNKESP
ncbi:Uncharacterised protein [Chlamydia trachomatis]|nr:Uncharacterised protein [Chlamydia trachomatis]